MCRLLLAIIDRPFRDGEGHDGFTGADKAEVLLLLSVLGGYGIGYACWFITDSGGKLTATQDAAAIVRHISTARSKPQLITWAACY